MVFKVATINVQGLRDHKNRKGVFQSLQPQNFDLIALQETHGDAAVVPQWQRDWPGVSCWSEAGPTSARVVLLFSSDLQVSFCDHVSDQHGRLLRASVQIADSKQQVLTVYGPNPKRLNGSNQFFQQIDSYLDQKLPLILLGDFNMVEKPFQDRDGGNIRNLQHMYGLTALQRLLKDHNLVDALRTTNPKQRAFTWHCKYNNIKSSIDRIYIPSSFVKYVSSSVISHFVWSDHDVCAMDLTLPTQQVRGKGYWRLNLQFLTHSKYIELIRGFWVDWRTKRDAFDSDLLWWDCGKSFIKALSIQYASELHSERRSYKCDLLDALRARTR